MKGAVDVAKIDRAQISAIYAVGKRLGIVNDGSRDDRLHDLVRGMTGRDGVTQLSRDEASLVLAELRVREQGMPASKPKTRKEAPPDSPAGMTGGQQRKVWALLYELEKLDPSPAPKGARLCGVIQKVLGISAEPSAPFRWLDFQMGRKLIETLKGYISNEKRQILRR